MPPDARKTRRSPAESYFRAGQDLPFWIGKLEQLLGDDVPPPVRSKAQYEIAVAYLRGLGDMRPADHLVAAFIGDALTATEPSALRDAAVLAGYCIGATARRLTAHAEAQIIRNVRRLIWQRHREPPSAWPKTRMC